MSYFEEQLIVHASPVISGLKASNMFSIPIKPVSYTHLDVYKRQGMVIFCIMLVLRSC